jgi:hypothetical protein
MPESPAAETAQPPETAGWSRFIPLGVLAVLLILIGFGIWQKASKAITPPLYDAHQYHQKAANCWKALNSAEPVNLLNIEPVTRPPGTLLISHPFGFNPDFRGFFFRTVYVPLVIVLLALWFLMESNVTKPAQRWANLAAVLGVAGLPLFYHLEVNEAIHSPTWWGLMDAFEASLAVLAVALLLVSARRLSFLLLAAGASVAAFSLLVKPVGIIIIPLIFWHWAAELFIIHAPIGKVWRSNQRLRIYTVAAVLFSLLVCSTVAFLCVNSRFLNHDGFHHFQHAFGIWMDRIKGVHLDRILKRNHYTLGWHWTAVLAILVVGRTISLFRGLKIRNISAEDIRFFAAFAAFCGGICWWETMTGPVFRYIEPFLLVSLAVVIPDLAKSAAGWTRQMKVPLGIACCAPFLLILSLVVAHHPPLPLQRLAGVNLSTGQFAEEVSLGKFLMAESARQGHRELTVYSMAQDPRKGIVGATGICYAMQQGETPGFHLVFNLDWVRPTMIRRKQIVNADFILFRPVADPAQLDQWLAQKTLPDYRAEEKLFEAWLTRAGAHEGLEPAGGGTLRLLKITDRAKFDAAFTQLMETHQWRPQFYEENAK